MTSNDFYGFPQYTTYQFTREEAEQMSKCRIIQNNLVHVQGFPDSIADQGLLSQNEYFGQFGRILKLVLVKKVDKNNKKQTNSAYITYSNTLEAAYAVLSIDSITIEGHYVRAFFGTSKYCIHFLNNTECYNKDKCLFIHHIARPEDIIGTSNFGYAEHLKLAKEICARGQSELQRNRISLEMINDSNNSSNSNGFNSLQCFISKEDVMNQSPTLSPINHLTRANTGNSTESVNPIKIIYSNSIENDHHNHSHSHSSSNIFKSKDRSRFYHNNPNVLYSNTDPEIDSIPSYILNLVDELALRSSFFNNITKALSTEKFEKDYCKTKYQNYTKDSWFNFIFGQ